MKIKLEYIHLEITIEASTLETAIDAIITGASVLSKLQELGYGKPKITMDMEDFELVPIPKNLNLNDYL